MSPHKMAIRHLDVLPLLAADRLHAGASPNMALISIGSPAQHKFRKHVFGLSCYLELGQNGDGLPLDHISDSDAQQVVAFLQQAAAHPDINMLVVHSDTTQSLPAAVGWFASSVYQAKFTVPRRIPMIDSRALGQLELAAQVQVLRPAPGDILIRPGFIANKSTAAPNS